MSTKAERGTKRTCQNTECGSRFYDLNRNPVVCPICKSVYDLSAAPVIVAAPAPVPRAPRKPVKKPVFEPVVAKTEDAPEVEAEDALAAIETEDEPAAAAEDETFLEEEEEDGPDVTGIIGGPVAEGEEQT